MVTNKEAYFQQIRQVELRKVNDGFVMFDKLEMLIEELAVTDPHSAESTRSRHFRSDTRPAFHLFG